MGILRITLDDWQDMASATTLPGAQPGDQLLGTAYMRAGAQTGSVKDPDGGVHQVRREPVQITELPWQHDLLDPTGCNPSGWGWEIIVRPSIPGGATPMTASIGPNTITALPVVDGVRTVRLEDVAGLADVITGGLVSVRGVDSASIDPAGELSLAMSDGTVEQVPGLPEAIDALVSAPVRADAAQAHADMLTATQAATSASGSATTATQAAGTAAADAAAAAQSAADAGMAAVSAYPDPQAPDLLIISYPAYLAGPDSTSLVLPIGA